MKNTQWFFWPLILGTAGFATGFFGPILLNPDANQGPLLGIFITGPGGAIAGLVLGLLCRLLGASPTLQQNLLLATTVLFVSATLFFCLPEPEHQGDVIEASVMSCQPASTLVEAAIAGHEEQAKRYDYYQPRANWQQEMRDKAAHADGVVLQVHVLRQRAIWLQRKPWNHGTIANTTWQSVGTTKNYFSRLQGNDCPDVTLQETAFYFPQQDASDFKVWPPAQLANFLGLLVLQPVPDAYQQK